MAWFWGDGWFSSLCILYAVGTSIWLLDWFLRKQKAGILLLDLGKIARNKFLFWFGLFQLAAAGFLTWVVFEEIRGVPEYSNSGIEAYQLAFWWSIAISSLVLGLSKLEFRENGACFMCSFIAWQRVKSYTWLSSKPDTLTIRFKPRYPLFPRFTSMTIPAKHRDAVSHILEERLPGKNL